MSAALTFVLSLIPESECAALFAAACATGMRYGKPTGGWST